MNSSFPVSYAPIVTPIPMHTACTLHAALHHTALHMLAPFVARMRMPGLVSHAHTATPQSSRPNVSPPTLKMLQRPPPLPLRMRFPSLTQRTRITQRNRMCLALHARSALQCHEHSQPLPACAASRQRCCSAHKTTESTNAVGPGGRCTRENGLLTLAARECEEISKTGGTALCIAIRERKLDPRRSAQ